MRGALVGYNALLLQHAIFGLRNSCGFVARSVAAKRLRRHNSGGGSAGHLPATNTNNSARQESAAYCRHGITWALQLSGPSNEEEVAPSIEANSGASAPTPAAVAGRGILTPLKERMAATGEEDGVADSLLLYFAFGANMDPSILTNKRGVEPFRSFPAEAMAFTNTSSGRAGTDAPEGLCMCFCHRAGSVIMRET